ncbi:MAG TPA: hypothetical protein VKT18_09055, partial [Acidimicrobiales bacterium]|nr:hypothetical protein [Acidimicrobiales bacterium]
MPPAVVRVLPEVAALDRPFDYLTGDDDVAVGARVRVPLHGRSVRGWVVATPTRAEHPELKPVTKRLGEGPPPTVVELCQWAAWRWAGPWSRLLATASPDRVVAELPRRPAATPLPEVHNQVRVTMGRLVRHGGATLVRVGPCADPLDLVIGVLHGVEEAGAAGSVVVTTPTIGWAERLAGRLRRRGVAAAGPDRWAEARAGFPVVVGARAASLAPVPELAAAIVLDAHDPAYTQTQAPCWNGVALLAERCRRERAPLVMTSWCADPVVASLASAHEVTDHEARQWPRLVVADLRSSDPREGLCTAALAAAARHALAERRDGVAVCVVLQRLGAARLLACKACGSLVVCEPHGASLFERDGGLGCARGCADHPKLCVACGSTALRVVREGITTLTRRVSALLGVDAVEVSAATAEVPD